MASNRNSLSAPLHLSAMSLSSSLGHGLQATLAALRASRSGLSDQRFETVELATWIGHAAGVDEVVLPESLRAFECRNNRLAWLALQQDGILEALAAARARHGASRIGVFLGTSTSGILETEQAFRRRDDAGKLPADFHYRETHNTYSIADFVRHALQLEGPAVVVSTACSSSAKVFGNAQRMIAAGFIDAAVVGGVDSLCLTTLHGFHSLQLLSADPCKPYDATRNGLSIGEAAAFILLERADVHAARDNDVLLLGVGESADAHHMSAPHPEGLGARIAMRAAMQQAGLQASDIDYINLHGTATPSNDAAEAQAIAAEFGMVTPCSSTKGATGHTLGAAGGTEAIISALCIKHGLIPGGLNITQLDPALQVNYQLANRDQPIRRVLSNSFGFGGTNCSLLLGQRGAR
ncbi:beta-ketoacyl-[acyl-carrier-protein] synthase family protein [Uliginosibacterium sp. H3]|uniref:Beta-ketoacyl-[acyl-carrier-protein] synthase family protein n=1 Tax=Uliginosibacterium silvisoli TaxID=3114758 RepID=A0ABU6JY10_9RHOO|nr:beta-ketoacyl-[acyl-carrier-protein] synthase family protein [Uliginosibacterium sp. H3]